MADSVKNNAKVCEANELYFPVWKSANPRNTNPEYAYVVTGEVDGNEMDLNYCSDRYELIPNKDIFPKIEEVLNDNHINYTVEYRHIQNVRFYADYKLTDSNLGYKLDGSNDTIQPMLRVQHSYNGLTKYRISFGYFRLICSNGLVIPVNEMKEYNLAIVGKHTAEIVRSFKKLDDMLNVFVNNKDQIVAAITARYETLRKNEVLNVEDRIKEVLNANKISLVDNKNFNTLQFVQGIVTKEADELYNGKVNDWLIYNGINQYLNNDDRYASAPETRIDKDGNVLEYMLNTVAS